MNTYDFAGQVVVVTGAARGIGRRIAERFLQNGASVAVCGRSARDADEIVSEFAQVAGGDASRVMYASCDVSDPQQIDAFFSQVVQRFGAFDVLVNNAGIWEATPVGTVDEATWERNVNVNLKSQFFACQWFADYHRANGGGRAIVNISSVSSVLTGPTTVLYNMCKAGTNSLTKTFAHDLGDLGIRVNAVGPGSIPTDLNAAAYADPAAEQNMRDSLVLGRRGTKDEIASCVLFLASEDASYVTGQVLFADGGWLLQQAPKR